MSNIQDEVRVVRRNIGGRSLKAFADMYFQKYLKKKTCSFHEELYRMLQDASSARNERIAIAAPRGSAKSVIVSCIYVLWSICYKAEDYIVLLSDTHDQAVDFLSHIKEELENNEELINDFPDICEIGQDPKSPRWKSDEIITRNGVKVTALGGGQKIRGRRNKEARPSLIILDDIENDENTQNSDSREKLFNWFTKAILKSGASSTNVIVVGTIQHYDSLLAKLTRNDEMPGWKKRIYKSIISWSASKNWETWINIFHGRESYKDQSGEKSARLYFEDNKDDMLEGTEVLWPEKEDYYFLMETREKEGRWSFDPEKQNEPVSPDSCPYNTDTFPYWDAEYKTEEELFKALGDNFDMYGACDPSLGGKGKNADYSAIITLARNKITGKLYVIDADIKKRKPDELIEAILIRCQSRNYKKFVIEANGFQELMAIELTRRSAERKIYTPIGPIKNTDSKEQRILWLAPLIDAGIIKFSKQHQMLLEQLRYFPKGRHDDGPDALEMAVRCVQKAAEEEKENKGRVRGFTLNDDDNEKLPPIEGLEDPNKRDIGDNYKLDDGEDD